MLLGSGEGVKMIYKSKLLNMYTEQCYHLPLLFNRSSQNWYDILAHWRDDPNLHPKPSFLLSTIPQALASLHFIPHYSALHEHDLYA